MRRHEVYNRGEAFNIELAHTATRVIAELDQMRMEAIATGRGIAWGSELEVHPPGAQEVEMVIDCIARIMRASGTGSYDISIRFEDFD